MARVWFHLTIRPSPALPAAVLFLLFLFFELACGARILLLPLPSYHHVDPVSALGEVLQEARHDVSIYLPSSYIHQVAGGKMSFPHRVIEYPIKAWEWNAATNTGKPDTEMDYFESITQTSYMASIKAKANGYNLLCKGVLTNKVLDRYIKQNKFDLAIVDSHPLTRCFYALLYKYDIPYVSYNQEFDPWLMRSPALPSYVPTIITEKLTDQMSFWERLINMWTLFYWVSMTHFATESENYVGTYLPDKPAITTEALARQSRLWLTDANFLLDYPRPLATNEVPVSWALCKDAKALPKILQNIAGSNSSDGLVVVSLSHNIALPTKVTTTFLKGFRALNNFQFVWQYKSEVPLENIPPNVNVIDQVPVNDLVGHPKAKLFITSADNLDLNSALYHSVPVLCVPLDGTQRYNARKIEHHGYGIVLQPSALNDKVLTYSMRKLISNVSFKAVLKDATKVMKTKQPTIRTSLQQWIDLSVSSNLNNLTPYAMVMSWPQYLSLDVFILMTVVLGNILFVMGIALTHCIRKIKYLIYGRRVIETKTIKRTTVPLQYTNVLAATSTPVITLHKGLKQN